MAVSEKLVWKHLSKRRMFYKPYSLVFIFLFYISSSLGLVYAQSSSEALLKSEEHQYYNFKKIKAVKYPGDPNIDVTYYKLDLTLHYSNHFLIGKVTINAKSKSAGLKTFFLDLQDPLNVDSVVSNSTELLFTHSSAKLNITLDSTLNVGESFSVTVYYEGTPGSSGFGSFEFGSHNGQPAIWSLSEPYGASDWFPCKDTPADKADSSDVWITCDSNLVAASNGILQNIVDNSNGTKTYKWHNSYPIAQYLISIAVADYIQHTNYYNYSAADSMPIMYFVYPENDSVSLEGISKVPNMIKIFSERYGQYPFIREKYGEAQFGWGGGMEHQTCTSLGSFDEDLEAHELAHQWFGDKVTCADWNDIWLNEGFATYSEAVYFEAVQGKSTYDLMISRDMDNAKSAVGAIYLNNISDVNTIFNYNRTYAKGAVVLHMLRGIVGDSLFFKILRTYNSTPALAYGSATTQDFGNIVDEVSGSDLSYFFTEWIYGEGYPSYKVDWIYNPSGNNTYTITLDINQATGSNPAYFTMPIKIKINTEAGDTILTVFNDAQFQQFSLVIKSKPVFLTFDPDNLILKDLNMIDSIDLTKPTSFSLEQNYPNPFNPSTKIKYSIPVQANGYIMVKLIIYDILGKQIAVLVNKRQSAGDYTIEFPPANKSNEFSSGIYFYSITAGTFHSIKKMVLIK